MKSRIYSDPNCDKCSGAGMYAHEETGGMTPCDCHNRVRIIEMCRKAGFPSEYAGKTLAGASGYKPVKEAEIAARAKVISWIKKYTRGAGGLVLAGPPGNGKTHLLVAIGKALVIEHSAQPVFTTASTFLRETKARFDVDKDRQDRADGAEDSFNRVADARVLLMDDLGAERQTEWSVGLLCDLIDTRYAEGRTTLITTNFSPTEIKRTYGDRFADRLFDMSELVLIDGPSRRRQEAT